MGKKEINLHETFSKKGFSLIEIVIVLTLIIILTAFGSLSIERTIENKALEDAKWKISEIIRAYVDKSYNDGSSYELNFDFSSNEITVMNNIGGTEETLQISKKLEYYINIDFDGDVDIETLVTNENGGIERVTGQPISFSIYIFDFDKEPKYRIAIDGINASGLMYMSIYKNISSTVTYANIGSYSFINSDWKKE